MRLQVVALLNPTFVQSVDGGTSPDLRTCPSSKSCHNWNDLDESTYEKGLPTYSDKLFYCLKTQYQRSRCQGAEENLCNHCHFRVLQYRLFHSTNSSNRHTM